MYMYGSKPAYVETIDCRRYSLKSGELLDECTRSMLASCISKVGKVRGKLQRELSANRSTAEWQIADPPSSWLWEE